MIKDIDEKKIKQFLWLNKFLIFNKNNWLRNYMFNTNKFEKLSKGDWYGDTKDLIDNLFTLPDSRLKQAITNIPFNNQKTRTEIIDSIFNNEQFDEIIETGTLLGNTTEYFANKNISVTSVEISEYTKCLLPARTELMHISQLKWLYDYQNSQKSDEIALK